jgi:hypothetical protein
MSFAVEDYCSHALTHQSCRAADAEEAVQIAFLSQFG